MVGTKRRTVSAARQEAAAQLVLDLDPFRLCGVGCGEPLAGLAFLGPGCIARAGEVEYPAHGLTIEVSGGRVRAFHAHVRPMAAEVAAGIHPFAGLVRYRGAAFVPAAITSETAAAARFGEPDSVETLSDGWALTFDAGPVEWELLLSADGRLATVGVYAR